MPLALGSSKSSVEDLMDCLASSTESEKVELRRCLNGLEISAKAEGRGRKGDMLTRPIFERSFMTELVGHVEPSASAMVDQEVAGRKKDGKRDRRDDTSPSVLEEAQRVTR